ncbi:MAG: SRPBCC family protein [Solirubrobacterales bacterium]
MARLERNIVVRAPASTVWRVLVDPEWLPKWEAGLVAVEDASGLLDRPAASCTQVMTFRRRTVDGELEVTEAFAPYTRAVRLQPPLTTSAVRRERLVETDSGTQLTMELTYETRGGPLGLVLDVALTRPRLAMALGESLRNLRRLAESEP